MLANISLEKIKNFLVEKKLMTAEKLAELEKKTGKSGKSLEEMLTEENVFSAAKIASIKGEIFNLPVADLTEIEINREVLNILDRKVAEHYQMAVFEKKGKNIKVGLVNPQDFQAHNAMEFLAGQEGLKVEYFIISLDDFKKILKKYAGFQEQIGTAVESAKLKFAKKEEVVKVRSEKELEEAVKSAPVAKIVSVIIFHGVDGGASDIHIEPGSGEGRVRYRIDGVLHSSLTLPDYLYNAVVSRIKVLANLKLDETRVPQDGRIRVDVEGRAVDLRISVLPMLNAEKVVMRVLDTSAGVPTLAQLGFVARHIEIIERNVKRPHGLFLLTGPTGAGKTTTLYSILNILNAEESNITTLEDPVEYYITGVNQSQVNPEVGFTFASGLRAILRQDPNIIMVGEIRDHETAELAIHAGLTGHLVFSTLHTNSAWGAVPRLIDMGAEPFLLASTLNLVMAQRLVRKICLECKSEAKLPPKLEERIKSTIKIIPADFLKDFKNNLKFYHGKGCAACGNTGYSGRTVVGEIIEIGLVLRDLIAREFTMAQVEEELKKQNFFNLFQDGILKALKGITTIEEIMRVSED